jgi:GT2 family glycosyltransferase
MDLDLNVAATGPMLLDSQGRIEASRRGELSPRNLAAQWLGMARLFAGSPRWGDVFKTHSSPHVGQTAEFLKGACLLIRREAFEQAGGMDPQFFFFCEEADLCRRMRAAGRRIWYEPAARAKHLGGLSVGRDPLRREHYLQQALLAYQLKHFGPIARARVCGILRAGYLLRAAACAMRSLVAPRWRSQAALMWRSAWQVGKGGGSAHGAD